MIHLAHLLFPELHFPTRSAHYLRGYFGRLFREHSPLLHNHYTDGGLRYAYPLLQYKVMRGRHLHDERLEQNKGYFRRLGVVVRHDDQHLTHGLLRGRVDEVLELADGTMALLDYKFAKYEGKVHETYKASCSVPPGSSNKTSAVR